MKTQSSRVSAPSLGGALTVRIPSEDQLQGFDGLLGDHHYPGAGRPVGDYLRQIVERDGQPVALALDGNMIHDHSRTQNERPRGAGIHVMAVDGKGLNLHRSEVPDIHVAT